MRKMVILLLAMIVLAGGCAPLGAGPGREGADGSVDWAREARVVRVTFCCGLVSEPEARAYIPETQIWGDGRVVRVERETDGSRRVLNGRMPDQALETLLGSVARMGFFSMDEQYSTEPPPTDFPNKCIEVNLAERSRQVCELYGGAPDAFKEIYASLTGDLGIQWQDYVPERGYVSGFALEQSQLRSAGVPIPESDLVWRQDALGTTPAEAIEGVWIEGKPLAMIWQSSHRAPFHLPVVAGEGEVYRLVVQVPGVSWIEPPEPAPSPEGTPVSEAVPGLGEMPPGAILQYDFRPTFWFPEALHPSGRVPFFTLYEDGRLIYVAEEASTELARALVVRLPEEEADRLVERVLEMGFERLESHMDTCPPAGMEDQTCLADGRFHIYRLRRPGGDARQVVIYEHFANDPQAHESIRTFLGSYSHPGAEPYQPERAGLFIGLAEEEPSLPAEDWPFDPGWLEPPEEASLHWARALSGKALESVLERLPSNMGIYYFRQAGQVYRVVVVPWLPGADYWEDISLPK